MTKRIYLSTFNLKVYDRQEEVHLKNFNANEDFLDLFQGFMDDIYQNVKKTHSFNDRTILHITLDGPVVADREKRTFYGYLSSGTGGDRYTVRSAGETIPEFESDPDRHITFRNLFFYFQLPFGSKHGYLIIQKKRDLGAKGLLEKALNSYLKEKGYKNFRVNINNFLNSRVFDRMMDEGRLKSIDFIKQSIPSTLEDLYENGLKKEKGTLTTSIKAPSLNSYWKGFVRDLYKKDYRDGLIEIRDGLDNLNEIEFELELKGKRKTFHVFSKNRTQPDVEVSDDLRFVQNEPTTESLVTVSENLIDDLLIIRPNV